MFIENICNPLNEANGPTKCPIACIDIGQVVNMSNCHEYWLDRRVELNKADFDNDHLKRLQVFGAVMGKGYEIKLVTTVEVVFLELFEKTLRKALLNVIAILIPFCFKRFGYKKRYGVSILSKIFNEDRMPKKKDDCMYKCMLVLFSCCSSTIFRLYSMLIFALNFLSPFIDSITGTITSV